MQSLCIQHNFKMELILRDKQKLYYEVIGDIKADKSIFLLNGLSQSTASWLFFYPHFTSNYRVILVDFIFQGNSSKEGNSRSFDQHSEDIIELADYLQLNKIIPIGLSYGSIVAQHLAVNYPKRIEKIVLLSTFAHKTPYYEAIELSWIRALDLGGYDLMLDVMLPFVLSDNYFANPIIPVDILKSARKDLVESRALKKLMDATLALKDYRPQLLKINCPALIIHGAKDTLFPIEFGKSVADHIDDSKFIVLENVGHTLNLEGVQEVVKHIKEFL